MRRLILLAAFCVAISGNLQAQTKPTKEEIGKAYEAYATPGDMHKMLAKSDGSWTAEITMWMDPSQPPTKNKGTSTNKMILGGRYQHAKFVGSMDGKPFEGFSVTGYDNTKKVFQNTWVDNMGTGIMYMEGTWDATGKMIHYKGSMIDAVSGKEMTCRQEYIFVDANTEKMEMYMTMPGSPEMKSMEVVFKRDMKKK